MNLAVDNRLIMTAAQADPAYSTSAETYKIPGLLRLLTVLGVISFPTALLLIPSGGSITFGFIALFSLIALIFDSRSTGVTREEKWLFGFITVFFLAAIANHYLHGWNSIGERKLTRFLHMLMLLPFISLFIRVQLKEKWIWAGILLGCCSAGAFSLYQWMTVMPPEGMPFRATGTLNSMRFGGLSMVLVGLAIAGISRVLVIYAKYFWLSIPIILLGLTAVIASGTRGAWIVFPVYALLLLAWHWRKLAPTPRLLTIFAMVLLPLVLYLVPQTQIASRIAEARTNFALYTQEQPEIKHGNLRLEMWQIAFHIFKQSPVTGAGLGNYRETSNALVAEGKFDKAAGDFRNPHNSYLGLLSTQGLIGFSLLALVFIYALKIARRHSRSADQRRRTASLGIMLIVSGYLVLMLTNDILDVKAPFTFFTMLLAQMLYLLRYPVKPLHAKAQST